MAWVLALPGQANECQPGGFWAPHQGVLTIFLRKPLQMRCINHLVLALCSRSPVTEPQDTFHDFPMWRLLSASSSTQSQLLKWFSIPGFSLTFWESGPCHHMASLTVSSHRSTCSFPKPKTALALGLFTWRPHLKSHVPTVVTHSLDHRENLPLPDMASEPGLYRVMGGNKSCFDSIPTKNSVLSASQCWNNVQQVKESLMLLLRLNSDISWISQTNPDI